MMMDVDDLIEEIGNVNDEVMNLERRIDTLDRTFIKCTNDILEALKLQTDMIAELGELVALSKSPTEADLKKYAAIREAFDRYDFVRKLTLGKDTE